jgi:uroporphyrinogen-III decarboxylase
VPVEVSLNFMPAFFAKHLGIRYGEGYYFDPGHRADVDRAEARFLHEALGRHGVGSAHPEPSTGIFIQPVDLIMRTQGAEWRFPEDGTVESWGTPWADRSPGAIATIDAEAAARHPVIDRVLEQYRLLSTLYGERADVFGVKTGTMNVHTPYTTAHQLCGEGLLVMLLDDPAGATTVLEKVWEIYRAVYRRILAATGSRVTRVQLGDCAASMLSERTYREVVLPVNAEIARAHGAAGYHSCGASSHLLAAFADLPGLDSIQLGPGTDLARATRLMPRVHLQPLVDPLVVRNGSAGEVAAYTESILDATERAPATTLCAWSFDRDTPVGNVDALYDVVEERRRPTT